jgi:hypothetical protein
MWCIFWPFLKENTTRSFQNKAKKCGKRPLCLGAKEAALARSGAQFSPAETAFLSKHTKAIESGHPGKRQASLSQLLAKVAPIELGARVLLAIRGDVLVAHNMSNRVVPPNRANQPQQSLVLWLLKAQALQTLQLNSNRKIIAIVTPSPIRLSRMPGAMVTGNKLNDETIASNQKMSRHLKPPEPLEFRMGRGIQTVEKQLVDISSSINSRRKTNGVNNYHIDGLTIGPGPMMR